MKKKLLVLAVIGLMMCGCGEIPKVLELLMEIENPSDELKVAIEV